MLSEEYSKAIKEMPEVLEQLAELDGVLYDKKKALSDKGKDTIDTDRAILLLTYFSSENLAKHSKTLKCWTIAVGVATILLFISAVLQLVKLFFFSQ